MSPLIYDNFISQEEYLRVEEASETRNEYVAGRMFAMSGASVPHNRIVMNFVFLLAHARKSGCDIFTADMKTRVEAVRSFYYPDLIVTCEPLEKEMFITAPRLIIEVLSPSTKQIDLREKLLAYRTIPSLIEYVIVHQDRMRVEVYRKDANQDWEYTVAEPPAAVVLKSIPGGDTEIQLDEIFNRINLQA